jgi:probable F420-dependent oxidoreductase
MQFFTSLGLNDSLGDLAQAAETAGYEGTTLADHVFFPEQMQSRYPYSPDGSVYWDGTVPWPDPWVSIGAMAMVTTRLRFITSVYILPLRDPFITAKAVGTAAVVSGGRVILGGGIGWMRDEFDQLGVDFHTRGARTSEIMEILRLLWRGEMVEYHGQHYHFDRVQMSPAPPGQVPIYLGGESEPALRRAARLADGYISVPHDPAELADLVGRLTELRIECGRGDDPFAFITINPVPGPVDDYRRLADLGVTGVIEGPPVGPDASVAEHLDALRRFGRDVIARMPEEG